MSAIPKLTLKSILSEAQLNAVRGYIEQGGLVAKNVLHIGPDFVQAQFPTSVGFSYFVRFYEADQNKGMEPFICLDIALIRSVDADFLNEVILSYIDIQNSNGYPHRLALRDDILSLELRAPLKYFNDSELLRLLCDSNDIAWWVFSEIKKKFNSVEPFYSQNQVH